MSCEPGYLDELARELTAAGIRGQVRARIVSELADHLACDPVAALGSPQEVSASFADEIGTSLARRAVVYAFAALALAGCLTFGLLLAARLAGTEPEQLQLRSSLIGSLASGLAAIMAQVAFVAGVLAAIRALRLRSSPVLVRQQAVIIVRRACTGLLAGIATMAAVAVIALEIRAGVPSWWTVVTPAAAAAGVVGLLAALPAVLRARRVRPAASGTGGDLFEDLDGLVPPVLHGRHWTFALIVAGAIGIAIALAGQVASDPYDGIFRGLAEAGACLGGFAALGRYLGLRA